MSRKEAWGSNVDLLQLTPNPATIKARFIRIKFVTRGNLRAFADVELFVPNSGTNSAFLLLRGVRVIHEAGKKAWVQMPHQQGANGYYYPIAKSLDPVMWECLRREVLDVYYAKIGLK